MKLSSITESRSPEDVQEQFSKTFEDVFPGASTKKSDINYNGYGWKTMSSSEACGRTIWAVMEFNNGIPIADINFAQSQKNETGDSGWASKELQRGSIDLLRSIQTLALKLSRAGIRIKFTAIDRKSHLYSKALTQIGLVYDRRSDTWYTP